MSKDSFILATSRAWNEPMAERLSRSLEATFHLVRAKEELTIERLKALKPARIFFPHWSYLIPAEIYNSFECIIFHMTDVPFGRGGSPLQNLIARGHKETKMSALRCGPIVDGGDVYLKRPLSLEGSAREIFLRAGGVIEEMIGEIVRTNPKPVPQTGQPVIFSRRTPAESDIAGLPADLSRLYDQIRMLDADGYPRAFLESGGFRIEFENASLQSGELRASVTIRRKD